MVATDCFGTCLTESLNNDIVHISIGYPYQDGLVYLKTGEIRFLKTLNANAFEQLPPQEQRRLLQDVNQGFKGMELTLVSTDPALSQDTLAGVVLLGNTSDRIIQYLNTLGVSVVPFLSKYQIPRSANGQWEATSAGIVNHATQQLIVPIWHNNLFKPLTWVGQDQGVIYVKDRSTYIIAGGNDPPFPLNFFDVPQPTLIRICRTMEHRDQGLLGRAD